MRICLICTEIFAWGKYGGFGRASRTIGKELVKRGIEVYAVVPRRKGQDEIEILDGIKVLSFKPTNFLSSRKLFKQIDADIYHSQEPSFGTYLAIKEMSDKIHLITSRDPKIFNDWMKEFLNPSYNKLQVFINYLYEDNYFVTKAVRKSDKVFCAAEFLSEKIKKKYSLKNDISFLPTPIYIPQAEIIKSQTPLICYLARLDRRKRPELFFQLAELFPNLKFIAIGKSRDKSYNKYLKEKYSSIKNLEIKDFINQFENDEISEILNKSWILVNTASREGLPNSFLEALSHKCAILSSSNPQNITEKFGYYVKDGNFSNGLNKLLENNSWCIKGKLGYDYVKDNFDANIAIDKHLEVYKYFLNSKRFVNK